MFPIEDLLKIKKECLSEHIERIQKLELDRREYLKTFVNKSPEDYVETVFRNVIINMIEKDITLEKKIIKNLGRIGIKESKDSSMTIDIETIKKINIEEIMEEEPTITTQSRLTYKSPFREEKVGSLVVYKDSNTWYDFGESVGGDNIALVMKLHGYNFIEACNYIKRL